MPSKGAAILAFLLFLQSASAEVPGGFNVMMRLVESCGKTGDFFKCVKIHALKASERVENMRSLKIWDDLELVKIEPSALSTDSNHRPGSIGQDPNKEDFPSRNGEDQVENTLQRSATPRSQRSLKAPLTQAQLASLDSNQLDGLLWEKFKSFLRTHEVREVEEVEGRRRKRRRYMWPLVAAFAIKTIFMAMSYKAVTAMAGAALIVGKIALVLSAILGLKKLVGQKEQKTTFEIVKQPTYSQSHSFSSSFDDGDGHYHRSLSSGDGMVMMDRIYKGQRPAE